MAHDNSWQTNIHDYDYSISSLLSGEYLPLMPDDHIYEVMPARKIYKINLQWNCDGWGYSQDRLCEEGPVS